ncbi:hypothetical protein [Gimesia aquarii]|uniref:Uncharacterized protein n=1 Tax=Gimesia aquarii TaxID=2527964 RepID=A0A517VZW1_9PLAN|nr:hypothetical protein [Gimesia aquarii]QDT98538.1 hypothetical protein V144x_40450 [Gimesia aquarii]
MKRSVQKKKTATQRRPTKGSALPKRRAEKPRSAMKAMQQRLGNRATQSLIGSSGAASKKEGRQVAKKEPEPETENQTANRSRVADTQAALPTTAIENQVVATKPISAQTVSTKSSESSFAKFVHSSATQIADKMGSIGDRLGMDFQSDRREYLQEAPTLTAYLPQDDVAVQALENAGPAEFREMPGAEEVVLPPPEKAESMTDAETTVPAQPEGDNVGIDPGTKPLFRADGEADTSRMGHVTNSANQTANQAAQQVAEEINANTSAGRIIPVSVDRQERIEIAESSTTQPTEQSAEMFEYFDTDVGSDIRAIADADFAPLLNAALAEPRNQVEAAAEQRDTECNQAFMDAQAEADVATAQARADQQQAIAEGQAEVQAEKEKGVAEQQEQLAQFNTEVAHRYQSHQAEIAGKITEEQGRANRTIDKAKEEAEQERKNAEEKAEYEKREREKNRPKEKKNLLGRIVSSVKRAVSRWKDALVKAVKKVFSEAKKVVTRVLDTAKKVAVGIINRLRDVVVGMIQTFASGLKKLVATLLIAFPKLRAKVNAAIDIVVENAVEVISAIAKRLEDTVVALIDRVQSVVTKIMDLFELVIVTQIQIVSAILNGEFLDAAKILFLAACKAVGIPGEEFLSILSDARDAFMDIIKQPARFLKSLIHSVGQGMNRFMSNFRQHFVGGITGWIFGAFAAGGITLPKTFTLKSVFNLLLEILGFTYQYIRGKVVEMVGERNVAVVEDVMEKVKSLFTEGPGIIWEWIKDKVAEVKQKIIDAVSEWLITQLIMKAANKLASMFTPVGAFVQAVLMMYNTIMFFIERIKEIFVWVKSITSSFTRMAKGMVGAAAEWIEQAMANSIPLIIAFLARLVGLGDIGDKIKSVVSKLRQPIDKVIEFVVEKLIAFGKKVWGGIKSGAQQVANWWDAKEEFKDTNGETHHLYYDSQRRVVVASEPTQLNENVFREIESNGTPKDKVELIRASAKSLSDRAKNEKSTQQSISGQESVIYSDHKKLAKHLDGVHLKNQRKADSSEIIDFPPYIDLRRAIKDQGASRYLEAHHLLEKRFLFVIDVSDPDFIPSVPLIKSSKEVPPGYVGPVHRIDPNSVTSLIRDLIPHGQEVAYSPTDVWIAHREVYKKVGKPEWANAIWIYFESEGVNKHALIPPYPKWIHLEKFAGDKIHLHVQKRKRKPIPITGRTNAVKPDEPQRALMGAADDSLRQIRRDSRIIRFGKYIKIAFNLLDVVDGIVTGMESQAMAMSGLAGDGLLLRDEIREAKRLASKIKRLQVDYTKYSSSMNSLDYHFSKASAYPLSAQNAAEENVLIQERLNEFWTRLANQIRAIDDVLAEINAKLEFIKENPSIPGDTLGITSVDTVRGQITILSIDLPKLRGHLNGTKSNMRKILKKIESDLEFLEAWRKALTDRANSK